MTYKVFSDNDVSRLITMEDAISAIEVALIEKNNNTLIAPARHNFNFGNGKLVFTIGAQIDKKIAGFRTYETVSENSTNSDQIVAVYDTESGRLKGVVIGGLIGSIRTGAIGGVAIKYLSRQDSKKVAVIGSGFQARQQLEAACAVRNIKSVVVYSRTKAKRDRFAKVMSAKIGAQIKAVDNLNEALGQSDIILLSTNSTKPVILSEHLKPGVHINTIGPKWEGESELESKAALKVSVIATDSLEQIKVYAKPFFLNKDQVNNIIELDEIITSGTYIRKEDDITLFCSVGLAGTEISVANLLF